ncbi:MAG: hypothetical protein K0R65_1587 [Crocinitomicaceae bacterium]|jgi:hypothetical protein|nr:hypothetical protein [Crocinitomicaceae bacterium]
MKHVIFFSVVFYITSSFGILVVDEYSVIKVIGGIKHSKNNKALYTGDKVLSNEKLTFAQNTSKAALISKEKGRFMLNSSPSGMVTEGLLPAMNNVSSRAGAMLNAIDLEKHFSDTYLVLSGYEIEISPAAFPMDADHFFFLRYDYKGETISKKLPYKGNKLMIDGAEVLKIDGKSIELKEGSKMELVYRSSADKTSHSLSVFQPVFADEKNLALECKLILNELSGQSVESQKEQLLAYVTENYGKPHQQNWEMWLKQNLGI